MATARTVGVTTFTTPSDREIVATRVVDAPRRLVWEAWTSPEHVPHWMLGPEGWTMPVCEIDLRPGGAWRFVWRGAELARNARHAGPHRGGRQDDDDVHDPLPVEDGSRGGARNWHEGRLVRELRSSRRVPASDGAPGSTMKTEPQKEHQWLHKLVGDDKGGDRG